MPAIHQTIRQAIVLSAIFDDANKLLLKLSPGQALDLLASCSVLDRMRSASVVKFPLLGIDASFEAQFSPLSGSLAVI